MLSKESIKLEINVPSEMRDGTILYSDIYRPDNEGRYPAILWRQPYNKLNARGGTGYFDFVRIARAGYAVVIQDTRGCGTSEGECYPHRDDSDDGYDTVEWVASQPWCDENVGMYGLSYGGGTQWAAGVTQPPHLKTFCPAESSVVMRGVPCLQNSGVFLVGRDLNLYLWCLGANLKNSFMRSKFSPEQLKSLQERMNYEREHIQESWYFLPLKDAPILEIGKVIGITYYYEWVTNIENDDYWAQLNFPAPVEKIIVPTLHFAGWYDRLASAVLANYEGIRDRGGSELARKNQKLIMGPWLHGEQMSNIMGELNTGIVSRGDSIDMTGTHIRWFDYWLKGIDNGIMDEPPIRIFVMGDNVWRDENEWPLARTVYTKYFFHSEGHANSLSGDGVLSIELPSEEQTDNYLYDPRNPVPTGGVGAQDQREVEKREDILVYTSAPLETDIEVTGPIEIKLWAASSAVDTDFTGKLVDVYPSGKAFNVVEGIVRARYRESISESKLIEPEKVYEYSIDLCATSNVFKTGHMIRVEISSSSFPQWDRNLNTGHTIGQDAEMKVAVQTIYHNEQYPSHIVLPVIPR
jgi:putative CocE/NonD family hydrolase